MSNIKKFCLHPFTTTELILAFSLLIILGDITWAICEPLVNGWHFYHPIVQAFLSIGAIGTVYAWRIHYNRVMSKRPVQCFKFKILTQEEITDDEIERYFRR
jgi:hypothetical protein